MMESRATFGDPRGDYSTSNIHVQSGSSYVLIDTGQGHELELQVAVLISVDRWR